MKIGTSSVHNSTLSMTKLNEKHLDNKAPKSSPQNVEQSFGELFLNVVDQANRAQQNADQLQQDAIIAPDTVNVADILIATEKARLSVGMLKSVTERAVRAYTEIMNIR
ncbi:MAG: flagellar hook-basal body complex protein FliE [Brevinemataceae bacterium]